jgi:hypothetical protein
MNYNDLKERVSMLLVDGTQKLRQKIFGANNEHVDFVMDSFYKLDPPHRNAVVGVIIGAIAAFVVAAFSLYYVQVNALQDELNDVFLALNKVKALKADSAVAHDRFDKLVNMVKSKSGNVAYKPYFEKISRDLNLEIKEIREKEVDADPNNLLASRLAEQHVDVRLSKVSIPKLLSFLIEVEKDGHFVRVQNLKITGIYGNKLYFDVETIFRGYKVTS